MQKYIYIVRGSREESYDGFGERIKKVVTGQMEEAGIRAISYTITTEAPPLISVIPFSKKKIACISVYGSTLKISESILKMDGFSGRYEVTEALPVAYDKSWENGSITPGACLLTFFKQRKEIDYNTFIQRWHFSHTPLSLKIHPLWHYNRNVVNINADDNTEEWDGIVEEHCRTRSELLNIFKFFGNPVKIIPNMISVYTDTKSFIDYKTIQTYLVREYHVKG